MKKILFLSFIFYLKGVSVFSSGNLDSYSFDAIQDSSVLESFENDSLIVHWIQGKNRILYLSLKNYDLEILCYNNNIGIDKDTVLSYRFRDIAIFKNKVLIKELSFLPASDAFLPLGRIYLYSEIKDIFFHYNLPIMDNWPHIDILKPVELNHLLFVINFYKNIDIPYNSNWKKMLPLISARKSSFFEYLLWIQLSELQLYNNLTNK
jgi:hypothetical protein